MANFNATVFLGLGIGILNTGRNASHRASAVIGFGIGATTGSSARANKNYTAQVLMGLGLSAQASASVPVSDNFTVREALNDIGGIFNSCCLSTGTGEFSAEVLGYLNSAMQYLHSNARNLPFLTRRTRYYFGDTSDSQGKNLFKVDDDVQSVDGYVRIAHPWTSFIFDLLGASGQTETYDPFLTGAKIELSFDGDYYRVQLPAATSAEDLQASIQELIQNEARVWVTYKRRQYLKITFDRTPTFEVTENVATARPSIATINFNYVVAGDLRSKGFLLRENSGDHDSIWFNVDTMGNAPIQGDFATQVNIYTGDGALIWAQDTAAAINSSYPLEYTATASLGVVTVTANYNSRELLAQDGIPPTGLLITITQTGSTGATTVIFNEGPDAAFLTSAAGNVLNASTVSDTYPGQDVATLQPCATRRRFDAASQMYGSARVYFLERQHVAKADSAQVYLMVSPEISADCIIAMDCQVQAPRYTWADYQKRTALPIPHEYVESILMPIARYLATNNIRYRRRERHESILSQYQEALKIMGVVDPQTSPVKDGKEESSR